MPKEEASLRADRRKLLGQVLLEKGKVSGPHLEEALALQQQSSERLGQLLSRLGHVDTQTVREALVEQAGLPRVDIEESQIDPEALAALPAEVVFRHKVLPISTHNRTLAVAMADPFDLAAVELLRVLTGLRIERHYCPEAELLEASRRMYGSSVARMIADLDTPGQSQTSEEELTHQLQEMAREPSIVNLVNLVIMEAIEARASDIHIEPFEKDIKVKYRIDGILHEMSPPPKRFQPAMI